MATTVPMTDAEQALGGLAAEAPNDPRQRWRPTPQGYAARFAVLILLGLLALWLPHWLSGAKPGGVLVFDLSKAIIFAIIALSLNVLMGYAGQASLGHAAFVGAGAFAGGYFSVDMGFGFAGAVVGSMLIGGFLALVLGGIALRVKGLHLAIVTIAYQFLAEETLFKIEALTGGGAGKVVPRPEFLTTSSTILGAEVSADEKYAYFAMVVLVLVWLFDWRLTSSKAGRAIRALRDDERVAASWGINVTGFKLMAFVISGAMAGLAGLLMGAKDGIAAPNSFIFRVALTFLLMTVVGGLGSRPGVAIGGFLIAWLPVLLNEAHNAWGVPVEDGGATCLSTPPKILQGLIALGILAGGVGILRRGIGRFRGGEIAAGSMTNAGIIGGIVTLLGAALAMGAVSGSPCLWETLELEWETVIGALLLLVTLVKYPGGIAEQFGGAFRWLGFQSYKSDKVVTVGGGTAGGGMGARP